MVVDLFPFFLRYSLIYSLISSVVHWLFSSMIFSFHVCGFCRVFFPCSWCLVQSVVVRKESCLIRLISAFLNLSWVLLWPGMWSVLENVPCALENNAFSATFGWSVLYISINSLWSNVVFKVSVYLNCCLMPVDFVDDLRPQFFKCEEDTGDSCIWKCKCWISVFIVVQSLSNSELTESLHLYNKCMK